tara:strand:- start:1922 stop:2359 length:438 start_codon:yes stop_codon:yes gene_type:complete
VIKKKDISQEDIDTWKNYIKNPKDIEDKDVNVQNNHRLNHARYKYDLHGFSLVEANKKIKDIVLSCVEKNYKEILLITGKGIHSNTDKDVYVSEDLSKLRYSVPEYLNSDPNLSKYIKSISVADKRDGGDGAIIIKLKSLKNKFR